MYRFFLRFPAPLSYRVWIYWLFTLLFAGIALMLLRDFKYGEKKEKIRGSVVITTGPVVQRCIYENMNWTTVYCTTTYSYTPTSYTMVILFVYYHFHTLLGVQNWPISNPHSILLSFWLVFCAFLVLIYNSKLIKALTLPARERVPRQVQI